MASSRHGGPMLKDYRVVGRLGSGGMGEVYEGVHVLIGKRVAIKVLRKQAEDPSISARRMVEEARAVNAVSHPGIVDIFDAGMLPDGRPYLVMERLEGRSLHEHLQASGALPFREVFHVLAGILEPLGAAHRAGIIHRDLKPSNVFLCDVPAGLPRVKLLDFGIARRVSRRQALTHPLATMGSVGFMGPEHLAGAPQTASDLYALGCLAHELVTGSAVFSAPTAHQLAIRHRDEPAPSTRARRPDTPPELDEWILWLMEKAPEDRPSSADVALAVLREALAAEGQGTVPGGPHFGELARAYDRQARARAQRAAQTSARGPSGTDLLPALVVPDDPPEG